jgi:hypothetical protein
MASGRRRFDVIYGLILLSGLVISAALLAALAALRSPSGDPWLLVFALGASGLLPSLMAWLAGAVGSFLRPTDPGVRLATALSTLQLLLWLGLVALGRWSNMPTSPHMAPGRPHDSDRRLRPGRDLAGAPLVRPPEAHLPRPGHGLTRY